MIELLAAMTLLAILSAITVPTVLNTMETTRQNTVISDSKKFLSKVERLLQNNNNTIKKPRTDNACIIVTLGYLEDTSDFQTGPHGYKYSTDMSYVIVKRVGNNYNYYVSLVEEYDNSEGYYGIQNVFDDGSGSSNNTDNKLRTKEGKSEVNGIISPHDPTVRVDGDCTASKDNALSDALDIKNTGCNSITISNLYDKTRISC